MTFKKFIIEILSDVFGVGLTTYVIYFFVDLALPGLVSNYVNMNILLLWVIGLGVATVLLTEPKIPLEKGRGSVG